MPLNVERARRETPGCEKVLHLNNAGAGLMPECVLEAMVKHLQLEAAMGGYEAAVKQVDLVESTYTAAARLVHARLEEIAVVENATRAWDMAFYSIPFRRGERILTSVAEYASNYIAYLQAVERWGVEIEVIPNDEWGQVSLKALENLMDERVRLVSITHVPTNGGLVNPAVEIGRVVRGSKALYLLDACQSVGQMKVDVEEVGCHMLSVTGRKFLRGPRGIGFLYVRGDVLEGLEPPFLDLHAAQWVSKGKYEIREDARRFENWEANYAAKIGLGTAIEYALGWGIESIQERVELLAEQLRAMLAKIPRIRVADLGRRKCGIVTFWVEGKDSVGLKNQLHELGVNVSASSVSSTRLDMEMRSLPTLVRASVHYYNTLDELERFCGLLAKLIESD